MSKRKFGLALSMVLAAGTILGACGTDKAKDKRRYLRRTERRYFLNRNGNGHRRC